MIARESSVRVADEAWLALAALQYSTRTGVHSRSKRFWMGKGGTSSSRVRPGIQVHIYSHNVANPNRIPESIGCSISSLTTHRLFRPGDAAHPARKGKLMPERREIPEKYHYLLDWYEREYCSLQTV